MIWGIATPSACEKSRSVTPDSTVAGPVGGATSRGCLGPRSIGRSPGRWRCPWPGRLPPWSMTTRRLRFPGPLPPRGRIGLLGLPGGIGGGSVETREHRVDADVPAQRSVERSPRRRPLEAGEASARVDAAAGAGTGHELTVARVEALELALRRLAAAAGARADRLCVRRSRP